MLCHPAEGDETPRAAKCNPQATSFLRAAAALEKTAEAFDSYIQQRVAKWKRAHRFQVKQQHRRSSRVHRACLLEATLQTVFSCHLKLMSERWQPILACSRSESPRLSSHPLADAEGFGRFDTHAESAAPSLSDGSLCRCRFHLGFECSSFRHIRDHVSIMFTGLISNCRNQVASGYECFASWQKDR